MSVNDDFHTDARPFVAGSITGVRSFRVDKLGRLTGVTHTKVWRPGVNTATCPHLPIKAKASGEDLDAATEAIRTFGQVPQSAPSMWSTYIGMAAHATERRTVSKDHRPGGVGCECGFWAYFDGSDEFSGEATLTGIVEAQGVVTVGSKGFRAEKARVVALVDPSSEPEPESPDLPWWHEAFDKVADWACRSKGMAATATGASICGAIFAAVMAFTESPWFATASVPLALLVALIWCAVSHGIDRQYPEVSDLTCVTQPTSTFSTYAAMLRAASLWDGEKPLNAERWEAVRRNYPDVPVYPSLKVALRAHPLSDPPKPEPVTPENTPDFWERSA